MTENGIQERLTALLQSADYKPMDTAEMARALGIRSEERAALREIIQEWEAEGRLIRLRQKRYTLKRALEEPLRGRIRVTAGGRMLFCADASEQPRLKLALQEADDAAAIVLPVALYRTGGAMDGDLVRAEIKRRNPAQRGRRRRGRPDADGLRTEARVVEILERHLPRWVGIYRTGGRCGRVEGDGQACPKCVKLTVPPPPEVLSGMCVTVEPELYPFEKMPGKGRIAEVLGWPEDSGVDITCVLRRHALRDVFPAEVAAETEGIADAIPAEDLQYRTDCRPELVVTIDPDDARDFDDAIAVQRTADGWELSVHIADVSHYVRSESAIDREARLRGNSTYLPDRVLPMLPPKLCDDICSLREGEDRLTCLCRMRFDAQGNPIGSSFFKSVIRSRRRLTYGLALAVLESRGSCGDTEVDAMLREAQCLARLLRAKRTERGALNLDMPEMRVILNDRGEPIDVREESGDEAHSLVEEFMLAANEAVAGAINAKAIPAIHRVHEAPDPAKLYELAQTLRPYGIKAGQLTDRAELCRVTEAIAGTPDELILKTALLRSMMRARYDTKSLGHFGLNKGHYCHFTSPIRRYADLIVHRAFTRLVAVPPPSLPSLRPLSQMQQLADHISETERNSAAAEQEAQQLKLMQFMQMQAESSAPRTWQAHITEAWLQGMAVELPALRVRGFIPAEELTSEPGWFYENHARCWRNTDGRQLMPGNRIAVIPTSVDVAGRFVDFRPAPL